MRNLRCLNLMLMTFSVLGSITSRAGTLIDVAFTYATATSKTGFAATGVTANDFWNTCTITNGFGTSPNLAFVNRVPSGAELTVGNVEDAYGNGAPDPMYGLYLFTDIGNITVTINGLVAGMYDVFLYGHGNADSQDGVFQLAVGSQSYGSEATTNGSGWLSSEWQEGVQYGEFASAALLAGQTITITVEPGASGYAVLSGLQMEQTGPPPNIPFVFGQPANQTVVNGTTATFTVAATATTPLAYQWLFNNAAIFGANSSFYSVTNAQPAEAGDYSVIVSNSFGSVTSAVAKLIVPGPVSRVINVAFTGASLTTKTGFAATGVSSNDFWNTDDVITTSDLPNLKFMDGTASGVGLTEANVYAVLSDGSSDPMFGVYAYAGWNITLTITNLHPGVYDFYLYGKNGYGNGVFQLEAGSQSYGTESTTNGADWMSPIWQEGVQYVEFTNVAVDPEQPITVIVEPELGNQYAVLSGLQITVIRSWSKVPAVSDQIGGTWA